MEDAIQEFAFMVEVAGHLHELTLKLQGKSCFITNLCDQIKSFIRNGSFGQSIQIKKSLKFLYYRKLENSRRIFQNAKYLSALDNLKIEFLSRFFDYKLLEIAFEIFTTPFEITPKSAQTNNDCN